VKTGDIDFDILRSITSYDFTKLRELLEATKPFLSTTHYEQLHQTFQKVAGNHSRCMKIIDSVLRTSQPLRLVQDDTVNATNLFPDGSKLKKFSCEDYGKSRNVHTSILFTTEKMFLDGKEVCNILQVDRAISTTIRASSFFKVFPYSTELAWNAVIKSFSCEIPNEQHLKIWQKCSERFSLLGQTQIFPSLKTGVSKEFLRSNDLIQGEGELDKENEKENNEEGKVEEEYIEDEDDAAERVTVVSNSSLFDIDAVKYLKCCSVESSALFIHDFFQHWSYSTHFSLGNHSLRFLFQVFMENIEQVQTSILRLCMCFLVMTIPLLIFGIAHSMSKMFPSTLSIV